MGENQPTQPNIASPSVDAPPIDLKTKQKPWLVIGLTILLMLSLAITTYFAYQNYQLRKQTASQEIKSAPITDQALFTPTPIPANFSHKFSINIPREGKWVVIDKEGNEIPFNPIPNWHSYYIGEGDYTITGAELPAGKINLTLFGDGRYVSADWNIYSPNGKITFEITKSLKEISLSNFNNTSFFSIELDQELAESSHLTNIAIDSLLGQDRLEFTFDGYQLGIAPTIKQLEYTVSFKTSNENNNYLSDLIQKLPQESHIITPVNWENLSLGININRLAPTSP